MKEEKTEWSAIIVGIIFLSFAVAFIVAPFYRSEPRIHHTQDEYCSRGKNKDSSLGLRKFFDPRSPFSQVFGLWGNLK
jgi:hypothetical protein